MTIPFRTRTKSYRAYFLSTVILGLALLGLCYYRVIGGGLDSRWMILAALAVMVGAFTLKIPGLNSKIAVADIFILLNLIFFGPAVGCLTAALEAFAGSLRSKTVARRLEFTLFNMGNAAICTYAAGQLFFLALGSGPLAQNPAATMGGILPAGALLAAVYYLLNSGTVALMVALESRTNVFRIWRRHYMPYSVHYVVSVLAAALVAINGELITPLNLLTVGMTAAALYCFYRVVHTRIAARQHV